MFDDEERKKKNCIKSALFDPLSGQ
uniref:Uncharacterized protein n=1 Tax=Rhizophora mucronata TaxID=61149 RepID=A0A2P2NQA7_RHIMU